MRHPCRRVIPDSLLGSPTTSTQKLRPTGFGCATDQATWTCPAQKISPCRSCKPYRSCSGTGPTRSPPPSLPDGNQWGCSFRPLRRNFLRRNRNFFSDSCRICLCLATDQSATLYSAQRMSGSVAPKCSCLPLRQSGRPGSRPFLRRPIRCWPWADYCGDWPASLFGKSGKALWHVLRQGKKAKSEGETALRASRRGPRARIESVFSSLSGQFQVEETRARSV